LQMRNSITLALCSFSIVFGACNAAASCLTSGERTQSVTLSSGGMGIDDWEVYSAEIHRTKLANGFELGLQIEPATKAKYGDLLKTAKKFGELVKVNKTPAYDELVKISVYDMSGETPKLLTSTWGGANSMQGYGPKGGADRVDAVGEPGINLWLHKAVCVTATDIAKLK
ncbi:MAG: hypothetical protein ABI583_11560, partial [Betaproteobacteria bacterium]